MKASTRAYYASIHSVDRNIGRLLDALDRLGLADSTIVLFTSDHGYNEGRHGINTKGNGHWIVGGRTGPKRPNLWETSIAIPLIVRWPGVARPGTTIDAPVSTLDTYRSVLGMCGVPLPEGSRARGIDWSPALRGEPIARREVLFGQYDLHNYGLAYLRMARGARFKLVRHFHERGMDEFYDLERDPEETRNLLRGRLDDEAREALADLRERLDAWMHAIDDPLLTDPY